MPAVSQASDRASFRAAKPTNPDNGDPSKKTPSRSPSARDLRACFRSLADPGPGHLRYGFAVDEDRSDNLEEAPPRTLLGTTKAAVPGLFTAIPIDGAPSPVRPRQLGRSPTIPSHEALAMLVAGPKRFPSVTVLVVTAATARHWEVGRRESFSITYKPTTNAPPGHHGLHSVIFGGCATGHGVILSRGSPRMPSGASTAWELLLVPNAAGHHSQQFPSTVRVPLV